MENKQLFEKQANSYNPFFPLVRLEDIIETISDKSIQWILNNYNHIYVEYSESKSITRNKVPALLRRKGLWITYNINDELITEYFKGDNKDVTNYTDWTHDENWERFDKLDFVDGSITYQHLSEAVKQLLGSGNTITNYPDDEDLTVKDGTLKLKDRDYDVANFSGLGRIILRKNIMVADKKLKNILTQDMINKENTIYEIRYDFDLNGEEITIPKGCVLDFQGGSLSNGKIIAEYKTIICNPPSINNIEDSIYWGEFYSQELLKYTAKFDLVKRNYPLCIGVENERFDTRIWGTNNVNFMVFALVDTDNSVKFIDRTESPIYRWSSFDSVTKYLRQNCLKVPMLRFNIFPRYISENNENFKSIFNTYNSTGSIIMRNYVEAVKKEIDKYYKVKEEFGIESIGVINEFWDAAKIPEYYDMWKEVSIYIRNLGLKSVLSDSLPSSYGVITYSHINKNDFDIFSLNLYPEIGFYTKGSLINADDKDLQDIIVQTIIRSPRGQFIKNNEIYISEIGIPPYYGNLAYPYASGQGEKDEGVEVIHAFFTNVLNAIKSRYTIKYINLYFMASWNKIQNDYIYNKFL